MAFNGDDYDDDDIDDDNGNDNILFRLSKTALLYAYI